MKFDVETMEYYLEKLDNMYIDYDYEPGKVIDIKDVDDETITHTFVYSVDGWALVQQIEARSPSATKKFDVETMEYYLEKLDNMDLDYNYEHGDVVKLKDEDDETVTHTFVYSVDGWALVGQIEGGSPPATKKKTTRDKATKSKDEEVLEIQTRSQPSC